MPDENASRTLAGVRGLQKDMEDLGDEIRDLKKANAQSRRLIRMLAVSLVFDVCLSIGLGLVAWRSNHSADQARKATIAACESGNAVRKAEVQLWDYVLTFPPSRPETPQEKTTREQQTKKFQDYVHMTFAQRNCDSI